MSQMTRALENELLSAIVSSLENDKYEYKQGEREENGTILYVGKTLFKYNDCTYQHFIYIRNQVIIERIRFLKKKF